MENSEGSRILESARGGPSFPCTNLLAEMPHGGDTYNLQAQLNALQDFGYNAFVHIILAWIIGQNTRAATPKSRTTDN